MAQAGSQATGTPAHQSHQPWAGEMVVVVVGSLSSPGIQIHPRRIGARTLYDGLA